MFLKLVSWRNVFQFLGLKDTGFWKNNKEHLALFITQCIHINMLETGSCVVI